MSASVLQRIADLLAKEAKYERAMVVRCLICGAEKSQRCRSLRTGGERPEAREARMSDLLTTGEVSLRFGVHRGTVRRWITTGRLPAVQTLGGHARIDPADVERLVVAYFDGADVGVNANAWRPQPDETEQR